MSNASENSFIGLTKREWQILSILVNERFHELKREPETRDERKFFELTILKSKLEIILNDWKHYDWEHYIIEITPRRLARGRRENL